MCAAVKNLQSILHGIFGYSTFRPGQLDAALPALYGRDVFTRMATGAGKSLLMFSVPLAHSNEAVGVIISPLISLMDEQVRKCNTQALHCSVTLAYIRPKAHKARYHSNQSFRLCTKLC